MAGMPNKAILDRSRERVSQFSRYQKRAFLKAFGSERMEQEESAPLRSRILPRNKRRAKIQWTLSGLHTR